uniref:Uncharacterized protein n=1 Tax=Strongyloides papillosus TaxID=174720 RepID=A0A0N5B3X0_STREA
MISSQSRENLKEWIIGKISANFDSSLAHVQILRRNIKNVLEKCRSDLNCDLDNKEKKMLQFFCNHLYRSIFLSSEMSAKKCASQLFVDEIESKLCIVGKNFINKRNLVNSKTYAKHVQSNESPQEEEHEVLMEISNEKELQEYIKMKLLPQFVLEMRNKIDGSRVKSITNSFAIIRSPLPGEALINPFGNLLQKLKVSLKKFFSFIYLRTFFFLTFLT